MFQFYISIAVSSEALNSCSLWTSRMHWLRCCYTRWATRKRPSSMRSQKRAKIGAHKLLGNVLEIWALDELFQIGSSKDSHQSSCYLWQVLLSNWKACCATSLTVQEQVSHQKRHEFEASYWSYINQSTFCESAVPLFGTTITGGVGGFGSPSNPLPFGLVGPSLPDSSVDVVGRTLSDGRLMHGSGGTHVIVWFWWNTCDCRDPKFKSSERRLHWKLSENLNQWPHLKELLHCFKCWVFILLIL